MSTLDEFQAALSKLNTLKEPETTEELAAHLAVLSEAIEKCEKLLIYMATTANGREEMISYLFEYKQLLKLQDTLRELNLPSAKTRAAEAKLEAKKPWWKQLFGM